jgi:cytochrome c oxidase cbb3-type subunit I/II
MPPYAHLQANTLDFDGIQKRVDAMAMLGVPYGDAVTRAPAMARAQATALAASIQAAGGPAGLGDKEIIALVAYLERLGMDIKAPATAGVPAATRPPAVATTGGGR